MAESEHGPRTGVAQMLPRLPKPVWVLQIGTAINFFGFGLVLPFEIIYLHDVRGFATTTAGLILSTVMATAVVAGPPAGALVDRLGGKPILVAGSVLSAVGYGGLAFVHHPWQAFASSAVAGVGTGSASSAGPALISTFVSGATRASAFALSRVAVNLGIGLGSVTGGFIATTGQPRTFQALYLLDTLTFLLFALLVLVVVPAHRARTDAAARSEPAGGFRRVLRDRPFVGLMLANVVFIIVGFTLFGNILPPFAKNQTQVTERGIGFAFLVNTTFIIVAQLPIANVVFRLRRITALFAMTVIWAIACLTVIPSADVGSRIAATAIVAFAGIIFGVGECIHAAVLGPTVADLAPPRLVGRYMATLGLSVSTGFALGPAIGSGLLSLSPSGLWIVTALLVGLTGVGVLKLQGRLPEHERHISLAPAAIELEPAP